MGVRQAAPSARRIGISFLISSVFPCNCLVYQLTRLPNGLRLVTATLPQMASVSVGVWVGVGGRYEPAPLNGVSHFIEHMLFKGTRCRSAAEISRAVEGLGGQLNAFTDEEYTCFHARAHHAHLPVLLDVLADMLLESVFAPGEITKERTVIKEELAMYLDQPHTHVQELLNELMWPDHPLGRPLTGTPRSLDRIGRRQMLDFLGANYVAANTVLVVAGPVEHAGVLKAVKPLARRFRSGAAPVFPPVVKRQAAPALRLLPKRAEQTQLALGIRACSRHDRGRYPLRLLNVILGENMSSRLFQVVREDQGLAYSIHSGVTHFDDTGALVVSAGVETRTLERSLKLVMRELRRLTERAPTKAEFQRARDYAIGQLELSLESTENHMMWIGEQVLAYGRVRPLTEVREMMGRVRLDELPLLAREHFRPERMSLALIGPLKHGGRFQRLLAA